MCYKMHFFIRYICVKKTLKGGCDDLFNEAWSR